MDFSNRDVAFLIWLAVAAVLILSRSGGREAIGQILGLLRGKLAFILIAFAIYIAAIVALALVLGFWNLGLFKETLAWFLVPGLVLLFGFSRAYERRGYYGRTLVRVIGLTAFVEFYVNLAAFALWAELLLLPILVLLGASSAAAGLKPETEVAKRWFDRMALVLGLLILIGTATYVIREWDSLDTPALALSFALPIWLTVATMPFIFLLSLYANYEAIFVRIDLAAKEAARARRRAKIALLASYHVRNRELRRFAGSGPGDLARSTSWREARRIIVFHRAQSRLEEAKNDLAAARLDRYAGVQGTDWEGRPLDQREFVETRQALDLLHTFHRAQHKGGRYRKDLMTLVGGLLAKAFPESEIVMKIGPRGRSWFAWRRTPAGWCMGIGATGAPPDVWTWEGSEPPDRPPGPGSDWTHSGFNEGIDDSA